MDTGIHKIIYNLYGIRTTEIENPVTDEVSTTATKILQAKPRRVGFLVVNLSSVSVYISMANDPSSNKGILLGANGGALSANWNKDFSLPSREWYGISSSGTAKIYIIEIIELPDKK